MIQAIVFFPLIGALIAGLLGRVIGHRTSEYLTTGLLIVSAVLSWIVFFGYWFPQEAAEGAEHATAAKVLVLEWIHSGPLALDWVLRVDTLTAVMLVVVTTVSSLVHVYSIGYMADDPHRARFFAYLSLFTFAMLMLVTADNFLQMFFGWEGVGLASYLLIGFWYKKPSANAAAIKAFVVNRVGDFGFALGIFAALMILGHLDFDGAFHAVEEHADDTMRFLSWDLHAMTVVCLLLFMGAMGKSAQFLLHTWLPDAMEGPTPVSALIHAATMVTAGVFMVARLSPMFEAAPIAMNVVFVVGAITAFFAATVGLVQNDIKRVIAYSTCSQLGYMFVALGAGMFSAGIFHLFTHAFFKALLFLGAGSVIHAMHHEQDMRNMGGLAKKIPRTYWMMLIGTLALTGVGIPGLPIGFAGFFSKDAIIETAYAVGGNLGTFGFWTLVIAAMFTSFYSWRLIHLTFHGTPRPAHAAHGHDDHAAHDDHGHAHGSAYDNAHESPNVMLVPLYILAAGAVLAGFIWHDYFIGHAEHIAHFFAGSLVVDEHVVEAVHSVPFWVRASSTVAMLLGFGAAWYMYMVDKGMPARLAEANRGLYQFLLNKWYFDELYDFLFVRPAKYIGTALWKGFDDWLVDQTIVEGLGNRVKDVTSRVVKLQSGYLYHYAFVMLIGIAALLTWAITAGGLLGMNLFTDNLLTVVTFFPIVGAVLLLLIGPETESSKNLARWIALATSLATFALSLWMWSRFDPADAGFQFVENYDWIGTSIGYRMGVDGVSILFVVLTALLIPACVLSSWGSISKRVREYMLVFLILETLCIGVFTALDLAMFYVFFEGSLIPMFLIIGIWGGKRRIQAAYKFFFYTFTGSVLMLLAIMYMYWQAGTLDIRKLLAFQFDPAAQTWLWLAFFASFAVKMPMWPFHRWLPEAHVEAPTAGSVILAAILLKLGGYGFIRFSLAMFPDASLQFAPFVFTLSIAAIIITSLIALVQTDVKKLIAYSSVAHMGFVTMGIFSGNVMGIHGAVFQMISHGIVSGALFLCVGVVYDRMHTREIEAYGGLVERMPRYAFAFMVFTMANVGLPGTSGFVGEFLTMVGVFQVNTWVAFFAAFGVILSAAYALWLYRRVIFGALTKESLMGILDLDRREIAVLVPLIVLTILFGFYPAPILDATAASVNLVAENFGKAIGAAAPLVATAH